MSRYLRRAALSYAAMRGVSGGTPSSAAYRAAPGHLGLARAHPSLLKSAGGDLASLLTPEAFVLDAAHALSAALLRSRPVPGERLRLLRTHDGGHGLAAALVAEVLAEDGPEEARRFRLGLALLDAEDGRFDDALARLAAERPSDPAPRLAAAGFCYLAGLQEEGNRWVSELPAAARLENKKYLWMAVLAAALGGAPRAVNGFEGMVGWAVFEIADRAMWARVIDGDMTFLQMRILSTLLWRTVLADKYKDYHNAMVAGAPAPSKESSWSRSRPTVVTKCCRILASGRAYPANLLKPQLSLKFTFQLPSIELPSLTSFA